MGLIVRDLPPGVPSRGFARNLAVSRSSDKRVYENWLEMVSTRTDRAHPCVLLGEDECQGLGEVACGELVLDERYREEGPRRASQHSVEGLPREMRGLVDVCLWRHLGKVCLWHHFPHGV
jgi:hypothetical protein